jgi:transposase-like protein
LSTGNYSGADHPYCGYICPLNSDKLPELKNPRVKNVRSISVRNQGLNSKVERLHGTIRDREKVMRGMQKRETAQKVVEAMRIHYNYCREHQTLKKTPAQKAGIQLDLEGNKIESLIRLAANKPT